MVITVHRKCFLKVSVKVYKFVTNFNLVQILKGEGLNDFGCRSWEDGSGTSFSFLVIQIYLPIWLKMYDFWIWSDAWNCFLSFTELIISPHDKVSDLSNWSNFLSFSNNISLYNPSAKFEFC